MMINYSGLCISMYVQSYLTRLMTTIMWYDRPYNGTKVKGITVTSLLIIV